LQIGRVSLSLAYLHLALARIPALETLLVLIIRDIQELLQVHLALDSLESANGLSTAGQVPSNIGSNYSPLPAQASGVGTGYSFPDSEAQALRQLIPAPEPACLVTQWSGIDEDLLEPAADDPQEPPEYIGPLESGDEPEPAQEPSPV